MRQFAWYSPEINCIVLQTFMEDCEIMFEWGHNDAFEHHPFNYVDDYSWIPLGEL